MILFVRNNFDRNHKNQVDFFSFSDMIGINSGVGEMTKVQFHITVKGVVIYNNKILVLKRVRPSSDGYGYWEFPGGGLEYGETPHEALVRELKEETGLDIHILKPVYTFTAIRPHKQYQTVGIGFLCIPTNDHVVISEEHTDYRFVDEVELKRLLNKAIYNDIEKTLEEYNALVEYYKLKNQEIWEPGI